MNLHTTYLGLELASPLVASASPLSQELSTMRRLADNGVGAIVMYSLFEEQIRREQLLDDRLADAGTEVFGEALSYFPEPADHAHPATGTAYRYLKQLEAAASTLDIPVIGSINGSTPGWWVQFARQLVDAGAAAIELNIYGVPGELATSGRDLEAQHLEIAQSVTAAVEVPVAVKLSPYYSSVGEFALALDAAGVAGLVLFNRFVEPDIDAETLRVTPGVELSSAVEGRLPRAWISLLYGQVQASLAATTGVATAEDVVKYLLAGADVVMTASALLRHGPEYAGVLLDGLRDWMQRKEIDSLDALRGRLAVGASGHRNEHLRAGYLAALEQGRRSYQPR